MYNVIWKITHHTLSHTYFVGTCKTFVKYNYTQYTCFVHCYHSLDTQCSQCRNTSTHWMCTRCTNIQFWKCLSYYRILHNKGHPESTKKTKVNYFTLNPEFNEVCRVHNHIPSAPHSRIFLEFGYSSFVCMYFDPWRNWYFHWTERMSMKSTCALQSCIDHGRKDATHKSVSKIHKHTYVLYIYMYVHFLYWTW